MTDLIEDARDSFEAVTEDEKYNKFMDEENIIDDWLLVSTPIPVVIILLYLAAIYSGKRWMSDRRPYELKSVLRVYDVVLVVFNMYLIYGYIQNPESLNILINKYCYLETLTFQHRFAFLYYGWGFLVSKIMDLLDTVFLVLRKKNSHITFLHVYHHVAMVFFCWVTLRYAKAFQGALPGLINIIVHVIMYSYYFLATIPRMRPYLWWKKHLTKLQMAQFIFTIFYIGRIYYNGCQISRVFTYIWLFNVFVFLCLFFNFYINAYLKPSVKVELVKNKSL